VPALSPEPKKRRNRNSWVTPHPGDWSTERAIDGRPHKGARAVRMQSPKARFPLHRVLSGQRAGNRSNKRPYAPVLTVVVEKKQRAVTNGEND
jgi:hypothetical protein